MTIHHSDTPAERTPMRSAVVVARRHEICRSTAAIRSHSTGAGAIISSAVALTAPTLAITSAHSAAWRHRLRVAAAMVRPTIHPNPAHGSNIAEVREMYGSTYGDSW
jgi:hypothetical protein